MKAGSYFFLNILLCTGEGYQGSYPQSWSARHRVTDTGLPGCNNGNPDRGP